MMMIIIVNDINNNNNNNNNNKNDYNNNNNNDYSLIKYITPQIFNNLVQNAYVFHTKYFLRNMIKILL